MDTNALYQPFSPEKQQSYEDWLIDTYGSEMAEQIKTSRAQTSPESQAKGMAKLKGIETALVEIMQGARAQSELAETLENHRAWIAEMWGNPCPMEAYSGMADLYAAHPDFIARYERLAPGFSHWLVTNMKAHAA